MFRRSIIVVSFVAGCCGPAETETEVVPECPAYCGSLESLDGRCALAFGDAHGVARECGPQENSAGCESLSEFSPGLVSDCVDPGRDVYCCSE